MKTPLLNPYLLDILNVIFIIENITDCNSLVYCPGLIQDLLLLVLQALTSCFKSGSLPMPKKLGFLSYAYMLFTKSTRRWLRFFSAICLSFLSILESLLSRWQDNSPSFWAWTFNVWCISWIQPYKRTLFLQMWYTVLLIPDSSMSHVWLPCTKCAFHMN